MPGAGRPERDLRPESPCVPTAKPMPDAPPIMMIRFPSSDTASAEHLMTGSEQILHDC